MPNFATALHQFNTVRDKLGWGIKVVGLGATLRGLGQFISIRLRRPRRDAIELRAGMVLEFDYPAQFPATLALFGDFIDPEFAFLKQVVRPDWRVVDVGAAIGQFSLFAALNFPNARICAFEPSSTNVATLHRNIRRNRVVDRVEVYQTALSNRQEMAQFETTENSWNSRLTAAQGEDSHTELVPVDTLDATLATVGLEHVEVLKINVAGFEPEVLEGSQQSLATARVDIMILLLGLPSLPHYAPIAALGYRFFYYHPGQRTLFEVTSFGEDAVLNHRPWPARHIIAIQAGKLGQLVANRIAVRSLAETYAARGSGRRQPQGAAAGRA